jgi:hypothetical protein
MYDAKSPGLKGKLAENLKSKGMAFLLSSVFDSLLSNNYFRNVSSLR